MYWKNSTHDCPISFLCVGSHTQASFTGCISDLIFFSTALTFLSALDKSSVELDRLSLTFELDRHLLLVWCRASQGDFAGCISDPTSPDSAVVTLFNPLSTLKLIDDNKRRGVSQTLISDMFTKMSMRKAPSVQQQQQQQQRAQQQQQRVPAASSASPSCSSLQPAATPTLLTHAATVGVPSSSRQQSLGFAGAAGAVGMAHPHAPASAPIDPSNHLHSQQSLMRSFFNRANGGGKAQAKLLAGVHVASAGDMDCSNV